MIYNGVDLHSVHPALSIEKEIPPGSAARKLTTIPGQDGERFVSAALAQDEYRVRVNIACHTKRDAWAVRALLAAWACSSERPAPLIPTHWPQVHYMAICKEVSPPEFIFGFATVTVSFALLRAVAVDNHVSAASGQRECGMSYTGSQPARPRIIVQLAAAAGAVTLYLDKQRFFRLLPAEPYAAGTTITIDLQERTVEVDGQPAMTDVSWAESTWRPGIRTGRHTISTDVQATLRAEWRNEWQ